MRFFEAENLTNFAVGQRRFIARQGSRVGRFRAPFFEEFGGRPVGGDGVVHGVEHLKTKTVFLQAEVYDLGEIAGVDVAPSISFPQ